MCGVARASSILGTLHVRFLHAHATHWVVPEKIHTFPTGEMENDPPSLRTSQYSRTTPSPDSKAQNYTPPLGHGYFKRFNKSRQQHNRTS